MNKQQGYYGLVDSYFIQRIINHYYHFDAQIIKVFPVGVPSNWLLCHFDPSHHFLSTSLCILVQQGIPDSSCTFSGIDHFYKERWFLSVGE